MKELPEVNDSEKLELQEWSYYCVKKHVLDIVIAQNVEACEKERLGWLW